MNILVISQGLSQPYGGAESSLLALIRHLSTEHQVTVVNGEAEPAGQPSLPGSVVYIPYYVRLDIGPLPGLRSARRLLRRMWATHRLHSYTRSVEKKIKPDLVISQKPPFPYVSASALSVAFVRDLEFITYFGSSRERRPSFRGYLQHRWGSRMLRNLARADLVVANSDYTRSILEAHTIRSTVIPPFISEAENQIRTLPGLAGHILFLSATLSGHKGAKILIDLSHRLPHRHFLAVGRDTEGYASKLPNNVEWQAWVDDPGQVLQHAAMLIVPSQWPEPFGRVVVEAQRLGIPVLASHVGGLPEAVGTGGLLVRPHTETDAWQQAIEYLYASGSRYATLSRNARINADAFKLNRALQQFDVLLTEIRARARHCA